MARFKNSVKTNTMPDGNLGGAVHYHNEPATLKISPSFIFGLPVLMALVWFGGVFLLKQADFAKPEETWAGILIATPVLAFLLYSWNSFQTSSKKRKWEYEKEMKRLELETLRLQRSLQPTFLNGSKVDNDIRLAELVMMVMQRAYQHLEINGKFRGQERPWSRRGAESVVLVGLGESEPVGEKMAQRAKEFLLAQEIVVDNQVNLARYPSLESVQHLLSHSPAALPAGR